MHRDQRGKYKKKLNTSLEHKNASCKKKFLNADLEFQSNRLKRINDLNASPEFQAKRLERIKRNLARDEHKEHLNRLHSIQ